MSDVTPIFDEYELALMPFSQFKTLFDDYLNKQIDIGKSIGWFTFKSVGQRIYSDKNILFFRNKVIDSLNYLEPYEFQRATSHLNSIAQGLRVNYATMRFEQYPDIFPFTQENAPWLEIFARPEYLELIKEGVV
jgi:hypothetical protein